MSSNADLPADAGLDGALDTSFSGDGKYAVQVNGNQSQALAVALQSDGKTLAGGLGVSDFAVARFNRDGSLDTSFDTDGFVTVDFGNSLSQKVTGLAIQSDGKIVAVGTEGTTNLAVIRLTATGGLDTSFSSNGWDTQTIFAGTTEQAKAVALQSDGMIVVAGDAIDTSGKKQAVLLRYDSAGALDTGFGTSGVAKTNLGWNFTVTGVAIQEDGKILVSGIDGTNIVVARFTASGSLDTATYGSSGIATVAFSGYTASSSLGGIVVQADGMAVVAGPVTSGGSADVGLARLDTTGTLDNNFDTDGRQTLNVGASDLVTAVRLAADGKVVVTGNSNSDFFVARFTTAGALDTTFNSTGQVTTDILATDNARALAIGPDYRVTVVGFSGLTGIQGFSVARYKITSSLEERVYAQTDANHNVTSVADVFGEVLGRFVYDPHGQFAALSANWGAGGDTIDWKHYFQGKRFDAAADAYDFNHRVYLPALGRFAQQDPIGYWDGPNRYAAMAGNPLSWLDPSGLNVAPASITPEEQARRDRIDREMQAAFGDGWAFGVLQELMPPPPALPPPSTACPSPHNLRPQGPDTRSVRQKDIDELRRAEWYGTKLANRSLLERLESQEGTSTGRQFLDAAQQAAGNIAGRGRNAASSAGRRPPGVRSANPTLPEKGGVALGKDIAGQGMKQLAQQTESSWYRCWERDGITRRTVERHFGRAYHQAVERAPVIRFSLDGIDDVAAAVKAGKSGFRYPNMTNAELEYLSRNPNLLQKTIFYRTNPVTGVAEPVPSPF